MTSKTDSLFLMGKLGGKKNNLNNNLKKIRKIDI